MLLGPKETEAPAAPADIDYGTPGDKVTLDDGKEYVNISSEAVRQYRFAGQEYVVIDQPVWLNVSPNGHRIVDGDGCGHYIPTGWIHLMWLPHDLEPTFVA